VHEWSKLAGSTQAREEDADEAAVLGDAVVRDAVAVVLDAVAVAPDVESLVEVAPVELAARVVVELCPPDEAPSELVHATIAVGRQAAVSTRARSETTKRLAIAGSQLTASRLQRAYAGRMRGAGVLLVVVACGSSSSGGSGDAGGGGSSGASTAEQEEWLSGMNAARAAVGEKPLTWDPIAAQVAATYAGMCDFAHNANRSAEYTALGGGAAGVGENIAAGTDETITESVASWNAEMSSYDHATNSCASGAVCGHYTQIVWSTTTQVGCAQVTCTTGSPFGSGSWDMAVCDFFPPGNFVGEAPY
jgi:uncharacterized protein YkwD